MMMKMAKKLVLSFLFLTLLSHAYAQHKVLIRLVDVVGGPTDVDIYYNNAVQNVDVINGSFEYEFATKPNYTNIQVLVTADMDLEITDIVYINEPSSTECDRLYSMPFEIDNGGDAQLEFRYVDNSNFNLSVPAGSSTVCESDAIRLIATGGREYYKWYWKKTTAPSSAWAQVSGKSSSRPTIKYSDLPGLNYGESVHFYAVGGCSSFFSTFLEGQTGVSSPFTFYGDTPNFSSANISTSAPSTICDKDGTVTISLSTYPDGRTYTGSPLDISILSAARTEVKNFSVSGNTSYQLTASTLFGSGQYYAVIENASNPGGNNCMSDTIGFTIPAPSPVAITTFTQASAVSCRNGNNGSISVGVVRGKANFIYRLDRTTGTDPAPDTVSSRSHTFSGLSPGSYSLTVQDACGTVVSSTSNVVLANPTAVTVTSANVTTAITCADSTNGKITVVGSGGAGGYTYSLNNGASYQASAVFSGLGDGTYQARVKDSKGCESANLSAPILEPSPVTLTSAAISNFRGYGVSCRNGTNGFINNIQASGGNGVLRYSIDGGNNYQVGNAFLSKGPGTYTVKVKDTNGCTSDTLKKILRNPPALSVSGSVTSNHNGREISCVGSSDGIITLTGSGGVGTLSYSINGNDYLNTNVFQNRTADTYPISVKDANECVKTGTSVVVDPPPAIYARGTVSNFNGVSVSCNGSSNGSITLNTTGGTGTKTYNWGGSITTRNRSNLTAGAYSVTITDANSCTKDTSFNLTQPLVLNASLTDATDITCFGFDDGTIDVDVTGGTGAYSYLWNHSATTQDLTGLTDGTYSVTVTDANSCTDQVTGIVINEPTAVSLDVASVTSNYNGAEVSCLGSTDGQITLGGSGGTGSLVYTIDDGSSYQAGTVFNNLGAGTYQTRVRDANNCLTSATPVTIDNPTRVQITGVDTSDYNGYEVSCRLGNDGWFTIAANQGTGSYEYSSNNGTTWQSSPTFSGLYEGTYTIRVRDQNLCNSTPQVIPMEAPTTVTLNGSVTSNYNGSDLSCQGTSDGAITLVGGGGVTPYTYSLDGGSTYQSSATFADLPSGSYPPALLDDNLCPVTMSNITITDPAGITASTSTSDFNGYGVSCKDGSNGTIDLTASGGTGSLSYLWSDGQTSEDATTLSVGTYWVTTTDANGCNRTDTATITEPTLLTASGEATDITCAGLDDGTTTITVGGGVTPYSYLWNEGQTDQNLSALDSGTYSVTVTDLNGCTQDVTGLYVAEPSPVQVRLIDQLNVDCEGNATGEFQLSAQGGVGALTFRRTNTTFTADSTFLSLIAGDYYGYATDGNGCVDSTLITISEPPKLESQIIEETPTTCGNANGSTEVNIFGGSGDYQVQWLNTFEQPIDTTRRLENLIAGVYTVQITDSLGCPASNVAVIQSQDGPQINSVDFVDVTCKDSVDGQATLNLSGQAPFAVSWDNGESGITATQLDAGDHSVTVTDQNACVSAFRITVQEPEYVTGTFNTTEPTCYGDTDGAVSFIANGGVGGYQYDWNTGATTASLSNLTIGTYTITLTDANGCWTTDSVELTQPDEMLVSTVQTDLTCNGAQDGSSRATITGGTGPYTYTWSTGSDSTAITQLPAGNYTLSVTDVQGCTSEADPITIYEPAPMNLALLSQTDIACGGTATGMVQLQGTGGWGAKQYSLDGTTFQNSSTFANLPAGTYTFTTRTGNGCSAELTTTLSEQPLLRGSARQTSPATCGIANGEATISATGGSGAYDYVWFNPSNQTINPTTATASGLSGGIYRVTLTDSLGCTITDTVSIQSLAGVRVSVTDFTGPSCVGTTDGQVSLSLTGTGPFQVSWDNGETSQNASQLDAGLHTATITDALGCTASATINLPAATTLSTEVVSRTVPTCHESTDGSLTIQPFGGSGNFSYAWTAGSSTATQNGLGIGSHTVTITDDNGCSLTEAIALDGPAALAMSVLNSILPTCVGGADGGLTLQGTGGNGGYQYQWTGGGTGATRNRLAAGLYEVVLTDRRGCTDTFTVPLDDPEPFTIDLGSDTELCTGSTYFIQSDIDNGTYAWSSPNGFSSTDQSVQLTEAGTYTLNVINADGCEASDSFVLTFRSDVLSADFLVSSEAYVGDTVVIVDISWPMPDSLSWDFGDAVTVITNAVEFQEVIYHQAGTYQITLAANLEECADEYWTDIVILERSEKEEEGAGEPGQAEERMIQALNLYPNPNEGQFTIDLELKEATGAHLQLVNLQGSQITWEAHLAGEAEYQVPVTLPQMKPGLYLLTVQTQNDRQVIRMLVR